MSGAGAGVRHAVLMGVSGSGKTTVAMGVAQGLHWEFGEADLFHPEANVEKMRSGIPLDDDDRRPWLETLAQWIADHDAAGTPTVLACSALRRSYRDLLRSSGADVVFVHLAGSKELISERMLARQGHFMPEKLLDSQFGTLEQLQDDEQGVTLDLVHTPAELVEQTVAYLRAD